MRPRRRFGQHFLEPAWVARVLEVFAPQPTDEVVEIGPGRGALTLPLLGRVSRVLAIEVDRDLAAALTARRLAPLTVHCSDVLRTDLVALVRAWTSPASSAAPVRLVGNLPYNISTPILFQLLDAAASGVLRDATVMLQAEVVDRLVARPGTGEYGVLGILTSLRADVTRLLDLPPGAFRPMPQVRSAVARLTFHEPTVAAEDHDALVRLVRGVFQQRRKTLANALRPVVEPDGVSAAEVIAEAGVDPRCRPESLQLVDLARLAAAWRARAGAPPVL